MLAPVTIALGVDKVFVGLTLILSNGIPRTNDAVCATFVFNP